MKILWTLATLSVVGAASVGSIYGRSPMENPDLFGGDMMGVDLEERNANPYETYRWPRGVVPFVIDSSLVEHTNLIYRAMEQYHRNTCVRFSPHQWEEDYVRLINSPGCYSWVGRTGKEQVVSLGDGCHELGSVIHELGHALGFFHEQSRTDRDDYLNIYWANILSGQENQFVKLGPGEVIITEPFDYDSIMLYGEYSFSKQHGVLKTMEDKYGRHKLLEPFDKFILTRSDIIKVNKMYKCDGYDMG